MGDSASAPITGIIRSRPSTNYNLRCYLYKNFDNYIIYRCLLLYKI